MAERKIFAGARLKRQRLKLGVSQSQMAAELGLSPSYLNLIERDQRPLTVQVLLKLSSVYGIGAAEFSAPEAAAVLATLKEVFADPLVAGEVASPDELAEMAEVAPNAARGVARLHQAWKEASERLSTLAHRMAQGGEPGAGQLALTAAGYGEASARTAAYVPEIEAAAEAISLRLSPRDDAAQALRTRLREDFGVDVRVLPPQLMPEEQARYDRHAARLFISARVPLLERPFLLARQIALLGHRELIEALAREAALPSPEAERVCRLATARRLAEAILAPGRRLGEAAREAGADIVALSERFTLRPFRIMARLAALGAGGRDGLPPSFFLLTDASGAMLSSIAGAGFPFPRFGPLCARLPVFDALQPGHAAHAELVLPDGESFRAVAIADEGPRSAMLPPPRRLALIGWRSEDAAALTGDWPATPLRPIGVTCRLCERMDCGHRVHAAVTRPAALQENVVGPSDAEIA